MFLISSTLTLVIDTNLVSIEDRIDSNKKLECVSSIMKIALNCTEESPKERYKMADIVAALEKIKVQKAFLCILKYRTCISDRWYNKMYNIILLFI